MHAWYNSQACWQGMPLPAGAPSAQLDAPMNAQMPWPFLSLGENDEPCIWHAWQTRWPTCSWWYNRPQKTLCWLQLPTTHSSSFLGWTLTLGTAHTMLAWALLAFEWPLCWAAHRSFHGIARNSLTPPDRWAHVRCRWPSPKKLPGWLDRLVKVEMAAVRVPSETCDQVQTDKQQHTGTHVQHFQDAMTMGGFSFIRGCGVVINGFDRNWLKCEHKFNCKYSLQYIHNLIDEWPKPRSCTRCTC